MKYLGNNFRHVDLKKITAFDEKDVDNLFLDLSVIASKIEVMFKKYGYPNLIEDKTKSWMIEKVNYFLDNCSDNQICFEVKKLCNEYVVIRDKIIELNLRLVIELSSQFHEVNIVSHDDIIQYGCLGLMKAVEKYDVNIGTKFSTYAYVWICSVIGHNIKKNKCSVHIPEHILLVYKELRMTKNNLIQLYGRDITIKELSDYTGMKINYIEPIMNAFADTISLDEEINVEEINYEDLYDLDDLCLVDMLADSTCDIANDYIEMYTKQELLKVMKENLSKRQYFILMKYFGFEDRQYSLTELAKMLGVIRQATFSLKETALVKLRKNKHVKEIYNK